MGQQLQEELRYHAQAHNWSGVVAVSEELAGLDPSAADPDGLATAAREQLARQREAEREAERAEAERQRRVHLLQAKLRARGEARDWPGVLVVSEELAGLDPTAADPDGLVSTAREQLARQQEAERTEAERAKADRQRRVRQLQAELRTRSKARDWPGVLVVNKQLVA